MTYEPAPTVLFRHIHINLMGPSCADPAGLIVLAEGNPGGPYIYWTGWKARLVRWLLGYWMPTPVDIYRRTHDDKN